MVVLGSLDWFEVVARIVNEADCVVYGARWYLNRALIEP
jgi:hypothetical protein